MLKQSKKKFTYFYAKNFSYYLIKNKHKVCEMIVVIILITIIFKYSEEITNVIKRKI